MLVITPMNWISAIQENFFEKNKKFSCMALKRGKSNTPPANYRTLWQ
jgi:hypothetical protein